MGLVTGPSEKLFRFRDRKYSNRDKGETKQTIFLKNFIDVALKKFRCTNTVAFG